VIDIADPAHPVEVGHIDMAGGARSITIVGDRAYVASGASLLVFDLTTLAQPVQVGIYAGPLYYGADQTQALHVGVSGDYVYVGGANDGLFVLQQPIAARLTPTNGATLIYTDSHGLATTIQASPGAVISDTTLLYASVSKFASPPGLAWGGRVFDLTAKQGSAPQPGLTFSTPITLTMRYSDADVRAVSDEGKLTLRWWNGGAWVDAVGTCVRASAYHRDTTSNTIGVPICRVGRYALFGPTHQVVLPRVIWNPT
jgi:LVIVD repeat